MQPDSSTKDARRTELLNAATELLATKPTATLAEVADHAGIGKATLHRYFASRDDLMLALGMLALDTVAHAIRDASQPERGSALDMLTRIIEALVPLGDKLHFLLSESVLDTHPDFTAADRAVQQSMLHLIQRAQSDGDLRSDVPAQWMLHHMNYALYATWQSVHDGYLARKDAARLLVTTLLDGFAAR
ncbi:MAG: TetR/AcrR family transcriptional regulator [Chloroflexota bacterium]|nr:TetR/AcrR family transcriptional regulator [Chloroflexota bacterium]